MKKYTLLILLLMVTGCVSNKGVTTLDPVNLEKSTQIFILKDAATRESVLPVLEKWFQNNGYSATVIESLKEAQPDNYVLSYSARWGWDMATYMRAVEMRVNSNGESLGHLDFDALQYGGFGKFGSAETRLNILLDALFGKITLEQANQLLGDA